MMEGEFLYLFRGVANPSFQFPCSEDEVPRVKAGKSVSWMPFGRLRQLQALMDDREDAAQTRLRGEVGLTA